MSSAAEDGRLNIVIQGAAGRMGCMLIRHVLAAQDMVLAGATDRPDASSIGQDAATLAGLTEPCGVVV
ncbi:MAG: hypothetical protein AAGC83_11455, partial [Pseudomonadota bacterium]